jgi:hypothetical protein
VAVLTAILEGLVRLAAIGLAGWLAYTEAVGTYEFLFKQQGEVNYIVNGGVGLTLAAVLLPHFMSQAIKARRFWRAAMILVGFILAISFVITAGVNRTGTASDVADADRRQAQRKLDAAKANVQDATAALASDKMLIKGECKSGVGNECKALARDSKETLKATLDLRTKLAETKEPTEDNTPVRLSALTGGLVTPEQIKTYLPALLPIGMALVGGLLFTLGLETPLPSKSTPEGKPWRWRREEKHAERQPDSQVIDAQIATGDPGVFLTTALRPGGAVREDDVCLAYQMWCAARGCTPIPRAKFKAAFVKLCKYAGFKRSRGKVYGMELVVQADLPVPSGA